MFRGTEAAEGRRRVKKLLVCAVLVLLAIAAGSMLPATTPEASSNCNDCFIYTFVTGDTLWDLTGPQWRELLMYEYNSWLSSRITERSPDDVFALVKSGEKILVPRGFGIEEALKIEPPAPFTTTSKVRPALPAYKSEGPDGSGAASAASSFLWWAWMIPFLLVLSMGAIFATGIFFGLLRRNPATAGPAIVEGGILPDETDAIESRFNQMAERRYGQIDPTANLNVTHPIRVGPIEEGTLSGWGWILFRDFLRRFMHMNREPAYRARFRFPNGTEEELFFLQRCGNDAIDTRYLGFRFDPRVGATPIPPPAPPTEEPRRQATAIHLVDPSQPETRPTRIVIVGSAEIEIPNGGVIEVNPNGTCNVTVGGMTFIARARRPTRPRRTKPAVATGTDSTQ